MKKESDSSNYEKNIILVSIVTYLATVLSLAFLSDTNYDKVFIGTIPVLLYIITFTAFLHYQRINKILVWIAPLLYSSAFYVLWMNNTLPVLTGMEGATLTVLNILMSYLINIFFLIVFDIERVQYEDELMLKDKWEKSVPKVDVKDITKDNFAVSLRGIEDKCKAINFVIGRVYSNKRGGSPEIRNILNIDKELYNSFSEITHNFKEEDASKLLDLLTKIKEKLQIYELPEKDIFRLNKPEIEIKRDSHGNSRILDVIAENDKDPIIEYIEETKEICKRIIEYLKKNFKADLKKTDYDTQSNKIEKQFY